jgi:RimJ/RimL family protein N-acetyltransferase
MPLPAATARLVFRAYREDDLPLACALFGDPHVTALVGGPFDAAHTAARLATELATEREHGLQYWPIFLPDGTHVGSCGLRPNPRVPHFAPELGFYLHASFWGQGLALEACRSVIALAFGTLDARGLFAGHHPENHASRSVLAKLGFTYTHHELYPPTGREHPCYELNRW